jgi:hypothetical protein
LKEKKMCLPVKPYKVEREWEHAGLSCAVVLAREAQHRCGYVRVPPSHPLFGKGYDDADVDVHGGLTFAKLEPCTEHPDGQGWWFGFDCAHAGDASTDPNVDLSDLGEEARSILAIYRSYPQDGEWREHYWLQEEVERETERLAEQLARAA